ncbi:MAG: 4-hydroxy-tetrahydrodipicolinate reductase [Mogibacterium sp.]|nr:4-hydroxy-tetrahydrodipicolinate reductase [Mogibacterium sp.]
MNIILNGAAGQMGRKIASLAAEREDVNIVAEVSLEYAGSEIEGQYGSLAEYRGDADCVVDFSHHSATADILAYCKERQLPVVIATTGQTDEERVLIRDAAAEVPIFFSANMSIGVAVTCELAKKAAAAFPGADIEIVEAHHNRKLDVPSGTALMIANSVKEARTDAEFVIGRHENGKRQPQEIGIHSLRMGNVVGMHEVIITTGRETITIKHEAADRALFADGAMAAAAYMVGKPAGLYNMQDMMK